MRRVDQPTGLGALYAEVVTPYIGVVRVDPRVTLTGLGAHIAHALQPHLRRTALSNQDWFVDSLRATFFSAAPPPTANTREWWRLVAGSSDADLVVNEGPPGNASASGEVDNATALLQVVCQPNRIDLIYAIATQFGDDGVITQARNAFATSELASFHERVKNWLQGAPLCHRVALGCVARLETESKEASYAMLQRFLPALAIDPVGSTDFQYQVNRPRTSTSIGAPLLLNRLSKWSAGIMRAKVSDAESTAPPRVASSRHYCKVELDINSAADNTTLFDQGALTSITSELFSLAAEILTKGEVA